MLEPVTRHSRECGEPFTLEPDERWRFSVGDALVVTATVGTNRPAVAVGRDAPEAQDDLTELGRVEDRDYLAQTPIAVELTCVGSKERLDAVHAQIIGANRPSIDVPPILSST